MTVEEIIARLEHIKTVHDDGEYAHILEDSLRADFLAYLCSLEERYPEIAILAKLVMSTNDIQFGRYYG